MIPPMARFVKVATPATAFTVAVPIRVPPDETLAVTAWFEPAPTATVLESGSWIVTLGCVVKAMPAFAPAAAREITTFEAPALTTEMVFESAEVSATPPMVAVKLSV